MKESPKDGRRAENARKKKNKKARKVAGVLLAVFAAVFAVVAAICFALPRNEEPQSPSEPTETPSSSSPTDATEGTSASDEPTTEPVTEPTTEKPQYPETGNESGTLVKYGSGILRVGNRAFSPDGYVDSVASKYAQLVSETADALAGTVKVYDLLIPTSYGVMMPDDIKPKIANYGDQGKNIETVFSKMSGNVVPVRCFENLMKHRSEYLYFRTDHHWNGIGAYYAYESFCKTKGITPYTMKQRQEVTFDGFLGTLYAKTDNDSNLLPADTVYAYMPVSENATMKFTNTSGETYSWPIIKDVSGWRSDAKYNTFAGSDNPLTVFDNPDVTDGSVCIVIKESFGNALMPLLVDHYGKIYEIDYRYWKGNLIDYAKEVGATDIVFANNISMVSTGLLVGNLSKIIK